VRAFFSSDLEDYLKRYWAVTFTMGFAAFETAYMRHYATWYTTRLKVVELDHHVYREQLLQQVVERSQRRPLPILFVNRTLIGCLDDVKRLEAERKLKDVLHFGFEWKTGAGKELCGALPAPYGDKELFRGRYRGVPPTRSVVSLPELHPRIDVDKL
jgi:glutaredoxin